VHLPPLDPAHWLYRLSAPSWLDAAATELESARTALKSGHQRKGVAFSRRAAGMAVNALLIIQPSEAYGRSYLEHLRALGTDENVPQAVKHAAGALLEAREDAPSLVKIGGGGDEGLADAACTICEWCETAVHGVLQAMMTGGG